MFELKPNTQRQLSVPFKMVIRTIPSWLLSTSRKLIQLWTHLTNCPINSIVVLSLKLTENGNKRGLKSNFSHVRFNIFQNFQILMKLFIKCRLMNGSACQLTSLINLRELNLLRDNIKVWTSSLLAVENAQIMKI